MRIAAALIVTSLLGGLAAQAPAPSASSTTCLVLPFENRSGDPTLNWIGDSFVFSLREALTPAGITIPNQQQQAAARAMAGAAAGEPLSHATQLRMADVADARWLITGWYEYDGEQLTANAAVFDLAHEHMAALAPLTAPLAQLETLQGQLDWAARERLAPGAEAATTPAASAAMPLSAYESFVRAQLAATAAARLRYLLTAEHLAASDPRVLFALGDEYWHEGNYASALDWLTRVSGTAPQANEAQFTAALAAIRLSEFDRAVALLRPLAARLPLPAVVNDLALAQAGAAHTPSTLKLDTTFPAQGYEQLAHAVASFNAAKAGAQPAGEEPSAELQDADKLLAQGALASAAQLYQTVALDAASSTPQRAAAHAGEAQVCYARHDLTGARRELAAALAADPENAHALALKKTLVGAAH